MTDDELIGRAGLVERAHKQLETRGSVLLYGPTGIGKSAVGRALVAERTRAGCPVLTAAPSQSETGLPYVTLLDLLSNQLELAWQVLPHHLRQPLQGALLHARARARDSRLAPPSLCGTSSRCDSQYCMCCGGWRRPGRCCSWWTTSSGWT